MDDNIKFNAAGKSSGTSLIAAMVPKIFEMIDA